MKNQNSKGNYYKARYVPKNGDELHKIIVYKWTEQAIYNWGILDVSDIDVSEIENGDFCYWKYLDDAHNIKATGGAFEGTKPSDIIGLEKWDMSKAKRICYMFGQGVLDNYQKPIFDISFWNLKQASNPDDVNSFIMPPYVGEEFPPTKSNLNLHEIKLPDKEHRSWALEQDIVTHFEKVNYNPNVTYVPKKFLGLQYGWKPVMHDWKENFYITDGSGDIIEEFSTQFI